MTSVARETSSRRHRILRWLGIGLLSLVVVAGVTCAWWIATRPYSVRSLTVTSGNVQLAASVYLPKGAQHCPGVVLVHGSWPSTRLGYGLYSDWFARHGVAVLSYDKRGNGASGGDLQFAGLHELAGDAAACWSALREQQGVDAGRVGFWGYSQGGAVAPLAASQVDNPAFVICLSGPGLRLGEQMMHYHGLRLHSQGTAEAALLRERLWTYARTNAGWDRLYLDLRKARQTEWYKTAGLPPELDADPEPGRVPYRWRLPDLNYDPLPTLAKLRCPVLMQYGGKDSIVPPEESIARIEALKAANSLDNIELRLYPLGGHALNKPGTLPDTPGSFADGYLDDLAEWVGSKVVK